MAYRCIEQYYGLTFKAGQRVVFTEGERCAGTVQQVRGDPLYVRVRFDDGHDGLCHPQSLNPAATEAVR